VLQLNKLLKYLKTNSGKDAKAGYLFLLPWIFGTFFFFLIPFIQVFDYAFRDVKGGVAGKYVGWESYKTVFTQDTTFIRSFFESIGGIFTTSVYILFFSMFVALILKSKFPGRTLVRAVFFLPVIVATGPVLDIINGESLATMMMSGERTSAMFSTGSVQDILLAMGLSSDIINTFTAIINSIFDLSWKSGIQILLFLAALQNVPSHLYEAAQVEGASHWESFWRITFPMIAPILLLNTIYTVIDGFTDYSNTIIKLIVSQTQGLNLSYASALGISYFLVVFVIIMVIYWILNRRTFYMEK
jgi:ABC-type sugar transport system permease subunit